MKVKELRAELKRKAGWKWYWYQFTMLLDFSYQYDNWLLRRHVHHLRKVEYYLEKIKIQHKDL